MIDWAGITVREVNRMGLVNVAERNRKLWMELAFMRGLDVATLMIRRHKQHGQDWDALLNEIGELVLSDKCADMAQVSPFSREVANAGT